MRARTNLGLGPLLLAVRSILFEHCFDLGLGEAGRGRADERGDEDREEK